MDRRLTSGALPAWYTHTISSRHVGLTCRWSVLLMCRLLFQAFELATGDYLFEPHSGEDYTRDEGWLHRTAVSHYHSVTWKPSSDVCVCMCVFQITSLTSSSCSARSLCPSLCLADTPESTSTGEVRQDGM